MKRVRFKKTISVHIIPKYDSSRMTDTYSVLRDMRFKCYIQQVECILKPVLLRKINSFENEAAEETSVDQADISFTGICKAKVQCL